MRVYQFRHPGKEIKVRSEGKMTTGFLDCCPSLGLVQEGKAAS